MRPKSERIFQTVTYLYSFNECKSCIYRHGIIEMTLSVHGNGKKTVTLKPCLVRGKLDRARLPHIMQADCYLLFTDSGDYILSGKYVLNGRITEKKGLVSLGTGGGNTLYDDIKKRLDESPLGSFAIVRRWNN
jgi:hypothetical protein